MSLKRFVVVTSVLFLGVAVSFVATGTRAQTGKTLTSDPLTGLPIIASEDKFHSGNEPQVIDAFQTCKSKSEMNMYSLMGIKMNATVTWYESKLTGFKKNVTYDGAQDVMFYKADRTIAVSIIGNKAPQGSDADVNSITYAKFTPGLAEKELISLNTHHLVCQ
jgi:hypothetical protein